MKTKNNIHVIMYSVYETTQAYINIIAADVNNISYQLVVLQDDFDVRSSGDIVPKRKLSSYKRYSLYVMATDTGQNKNYFTE